MSITADQHREVGRILGYPPCCIEAWVTDPEGGQATRRGARYGRPRTPDEAEECNRLVTELLGYDWDWAERIPHWVPCEACRARV